MKIPGFTLLELIIAMAISSMLAVALFTSFYQINRSSRLVEQTISIDMRASILENLLEKDISGVFVPKIDEPKKGPASASSIQQNPEKPDQKESKENQPEQKQGQEKKQELEKAFFYISSGKILKELTFITCNPLQIYGQTKPRMARVSYRMQEKTKDSYTLLRRESSNITFGTEKDAVEYEVINDIKELHFEFSIPVPGKEKVDFKNVKEWTAPQNIEKQKMLIPQFVKVNVTLWDNDLHLGEQSFEFRYYIYAFLDHIKQKEEEPKGKEPEKPKEPEKKPEAQQAKPSIPGKK